MLMGKTAIVTGGARGIGAGIARVLASQGARVAVLDLDGAEAEKTATALPSPGMAMACDGAVEADTAKALRPASRAGKPRDRWPFGGTVGRVSVPESEDHVRDDARGVRAS